MSYKAHHEIVTESIESVASCQSARSLGVIFDEHMSFHAHVSSICRSFYHLRNSSGIRTYLTKESAAVVVHAFVTLKLDYYMAWLNISYAEIAVCTKYGG